MLLLPSTIEYDQTVLLLRAVHRNHFGRYTLDHCVKLLPVSIIGVVGVLSQISRGRPTGGFWLLICFSAVPLLFLVLQWWAAGQIRLNTAPPHIKVCIEEDVFSVQMGNNFSKIEWSRVRTIWKFRDVILLFWNKKFSLDSSLAIPSQALNAELLRFIEKKVRDNGGKVV